MKWVIVGVMLVLWTVPLWGNNFYFTVDQGRDMVWVRNMVEEGDLVSKGPETSLRGIFIGPGWYYLLAPGYFFTNGHPAAPIWFLIVVNLLTLYVLMRSKGWMVGALLVFFWPWYDLARYAFNPFLLGSLAILLGLLLERGKKWWGLVVVMLSFNAHLFGAMVMLVTWAVCIWQKKFGWYKYAALLAIGCGFGYVLGPIWREWYVAFLWPILLIVGSLVVDQWTRGWRFVSLLVVIGIELIVFVPRYLDSWNNDDPGILKNQLAVIEWIYQKENGEGLYIYNYTDRFYDYPYQYLIRRYGTHLPCEYANFPDADKSLYVPGWDKFVEPRYGCDKKNRFLIIDSASNGEANSDWIVDYRATTNLIESKNFGKTVVEKRQITPLFADRYDRGYLPRTYRDNALEVTIPADWKMQTKDREYFEFQNSDDSIHGWAMSVGRECGGFFSTDNNFYSNLEPGKVNDYLVVLKMTGVMQRAEGLREKILGSIRTFEDNRTEPQTRCDML